jgi:hypothetical protein
VRGQRLGVLGEQLGKHVGAVQAHRAHPRQVVQADLVDRHAPRCDAEQPRDLALEADRDVAEPDGAVAVVEQRARDDPDRVGEVDDPRPVGGQLPRAAGDVQDHRDRAQRLRQATRARGLLADAAAGERQRLVAQPRRLAADADLDEHRVGAVQRAVELAGDGERAREALALEHPAGEGADDLAALGVDVVQDELAEPEALLLARQARHQLGRVGGAAADDRQLHPLTPVSVTPSTNARCAAKKSAMTGAMNSSVAAMVRFHCTW